MKNIYFFFIIIYIGMHVNIYSQTLYRSGMFLHHSTGESIWGPNGSNTSVPQQMIQYNQLHGYTGNDAVTLNETWFPSSDNEWFTWHQIFDNSDPNNNILSHLQNNKIIIIKSCYPSSNIVGLGAPGDTLSNPSRKTIYNYKWHWRNIISVMRQHPENFFVIWTNAPLVPSATNNQEASLSNQFCSWANDTLAIGIDPIFGAFPSNVYVFDFFHKLADANGMLQLQYASSSNDSHPNSAATELVAPQFVQEIFNASINYEATTGNTTFQLSAAMQNGWNLVSIPGLHPVNQNIDTWWVNRDPLADVFRYSGSYQSVTSLTPGTGYWMKHTNSQIYNTGDEWPADGIQIVPHNPINAINGWNIIGGYEFNSPTAGITTTPSGLQTGLIYGYSSVEGYQAASNLNPGYGYWIKLTGEGQINLPSTFFKGNSKMKEILEEDWGRIIFTDKSNKKYTLYLAKSEINLDEFELPPVPPAGMFDIRYSSGRFAEQFNNELTTIEMRGIEYPIRVRIENSLIRVQDETGKFFNTILRPGEEISINNISISKLKIAVEIIPEGYTLEQNYPNPFNPVTNIRYTVGNKQFVTLKVYDILGNEIATLVNEEKSSGTYTVKFTNDNEQFSSGIYIYRLNAGDFSETRKMILMR